MYKITYDNIDDLRKKLNETKNRDENINIECVGKNSFKVDITKLSGSGRTELFYKDGYTSRYINYTKTFGKEHKNIESIYYRDGREYHAQWLNDSKNPHFSGEFKDGKRHGKQIWWFGSDVIQSERIFVDGEFIKYHDYHHSEIYNIEYGRLDEFFEVLRKAQASSENIEFKNDKYVGREMIGFIVNNIWHRVAVSYFNDVLGLFEVKIKKGKDE